MSGNNIKVVCRFRPFNRLEVENASTECIQVLDDVSVKMIEGSAAGGDGDGFSFDRVFPAESTQAEIFDFGVKGIVEDVMTGFNGTLFCYGQTGSGKTFTMMGADIDNPTLKGLIPRITEQIFASISQAESNIEYTVKVSYMEIYMERIKDLLAPQNDNLTIHEDKARGVYVKGLTDVYVGGQAEVFAVMKAGAKSRVVSSTQMNAESSRSHSIFVIAIHQRNVDNGSQKSGNLYLVDLAGSEKVGKTGASGQTLEEAKKINKSLSALGMVINSLTDGKSSHIPYRDSKLTRILQESLGGNSRTTLIVNCSPASYNEAETLSTLRFGMRAKSIKNKARVNTELSPAELKVLLGKTKGSLAFVESYRDALLGEVGVWRTGGRVEEGEWVTEEKLKGGAVPASTVKKPAVAQSPGVSVPASRSQTPLLLDAFKESPSTTASGRGSPSVLAPSRLEMDERDEFLRRENEMNDTLAERESALAEAEEMVRKLQEEKTTWLAEREKLHKDYSSVRREVDEMQSSAHRLEEDAKEAGTSLDLARERELELGKELDLVKLQMEEMKSTHALAAAEERERKRTEIKAEMASTLDQSGGYVNAGAEALRGLLHRLDSVSGPKEDREIIRKHLSDSQAVFQSLHDRLRRAQDEVKEKEDVVKDLTDLIEEKELAESEDQYGAEVDKQSAAKIGLLEVELGSVKRWSVQQQGEIEKLQDELRDRIDSVDNLNRLLAEATAGLQGGAEFAKAIQELEQLKRQLELQSTDSEAAIRALTRDLHDAIDQRIDLQAQVDQYKEKYMMLAKQTNAKAHNKKMQILEYNIGQLNEVHRDLIAQNSQLKRDLNTFVRKCDERQKRIYDLEQDCSELDQIRLHSEDMERELGALRQQMMAQASLGSGMGWGRIAKPMRGGGGNVGQASLDIPVVASQENGSSGHNRGRTSWFR